MIIRATANLRQVLDESGAVKCGAAAPDETWYANLVRFSRSRWLLLMHQATLFPVVVVGVRAADLREFPGLACGAIAEALGDVGLSPATLGRLDPADVVVAPTDDRSMLGHLNQMKSEIEYAIDAAGGADLVESAALHRWLLETPRSRGGAYVFPADLIRELR